MCMIGDGSGSVYMVRVITPAGDVWEVARYGLRRLFQGVTECSLLAGVLSRYPTTADNESYQDVWHDLVSDGIDPHTCAAELVVRASEDELCDPDVVNGWRTVLVMEVRDLTTSTKDEHHPRSTARRNR